MRIKIVVLFILNLIVHYSLALNTNVLSVKSPTETILDFSIDKTRSQVIENDSIERIIYGLTCSFEVADNLSFNTIEVEILERYPSTIPHILV